MMELRQKAYNKIHTKIQSFSTPLETHLTTAKQKIILEVNYFSQVSNGVKKQDEEVNQSLFKDIVKVAIV